MAGLLRLSAITLVCREYFSTQHFKAEISYFEGLPLMGNSEEYVDLLKPPKEEKPEGADEETCLMHIKPMSWASLGITVPRHQGPGRKARWQNASVVFITLKYLNDAGVKMNHWIFDLMIFVGLLIICQGCRGRGRDG